MFIIIYFSVLKSVLLKGHENVVYQPRRVSHFTSITLRLHISHQNGSRIPFSTFFPPSSTCKFFISRPSAALLSIISTFSGWLSLRHWSWSNLFNYLIDEILMFIHEIYAAFKVACTIFLTFVLNNLFMCLSCVHRYT